MFCFLAALAGLSGQAAAPAGAAVDASAAAPKNGNKRFIELHESFLKRAQEGPIGVLFLGDSITEGWHKAPHIWEHFFGKVEDAAARMEVIRAANADLARLADGKNVRFLDINARFLAEDGSIPHIIMPDQLHPDAAGYELWAEAMLPLLDEMMQ